MHLPPWKKGYERYKKIYEVVKKCSTTPTRGCSYEVRQRRPRLSLSSSSLSSSLSAGWTGAATPPPRDTSRWRPPTWKRTVRCHVLVATSGSNKAARVSRNDGDLSPAVTGLSFCDGDFTARRVGESYFYWYGRGTDIPRGTFNGRRRWHRQLAPTASALVDARERQRPEEIWHGERMY